MEREDFKYKWPTLERHLASSSKEDLIDYIKNIFSYKAREAIGLMKFLELPIVHTIDNIKIFMSKLDEITNHSQSFLNEINHALGHLEKKEMKTLDGFLSYLTQEGWYSRINKGTGFSGFRFEVYRKDSQYAVFCVECSTEQCIKKFIEKFDSYDDIIELFRKDDK